MVTAKPTIVLSGDPAWADDVESALKALDFAPVRYDDRTGYVARLVEDGAALVLVDGERADWRSWVTTPKVSPATRKIPVVLVAGDARVRQEGLRSGADVCLTPDEFLDGLPERVVELIRLPDPATLERLARQCRQELPPRARQAIEKFNAGEYYKQHDLFEEEWMAEEGPVRDLYQAILQLGIAYYQITRGNHRGAQKMVLRSIRWLSVLPDVCQAVNVEQLREDAFRVRAELARIDPADIGEFDLGLLRPVELVEG
jgi:hypothetical protein